jgi:hypothetical protein
MFTLRRGFARAGWVLLALWVGRTFRALPATVNGQ